MRKKVNNKKKGKVKGNWEKGMRAAANTAIVTTTPILIIKTSGIIIAILNFPTKNLKTHLQKMHRKLLILLEKGAE